jgi:hypothetical protein
MNDRQTHKDITLIDKMLIEREMDDKYSGKTCVMKRD